jgi:hypothetical protein
VGSTVIASNIAATAANVLGAFTSDGFNLVGSTNGSSGFNALTDLLNINPLLGAFRDNGGQTPTLAPLNGSPLLDKGRNLGGSTDQRGVPRTFDFSSIANASTGDGTDIGAFELAVPRLDITRIDNGVVLSWPLWAGVFTTLQSATNLSTAWGAAAGTPVPVADQLVLTNGPLAGSMFFRLKGN